MTSLPSHIASPDPNIFWSENYVVLDFETTNLEKGSAVNKDNSLVLAAWYINKENKVRTKRADEYHQKELVEDIASADFIVAHNIKFEYQWLSRCGLKLENLIGFDTMIAEYVELGNRKKSLKLGDIAKRRGIGYKEPYVDRMMNSGTCPSELPSTWLKDRCVSDVMLCLELFRRQREELWATGKEKVFFTRSIFTPVLADIEFNGIQLDERRVRESFETYNRKFQSVSSRLNEFTGGINTNSPKQVSEFVYDELGFSELKDAAGNPKRTPKGARLTDTDTLGLLKPRNKRQREFLELQKERNDLNAKLTKALNKFIACVDAGELLFANFNQTITKTHRLSSTGKKYSVQFQNLAREFKPLVVPRNKDWLISEADGCGLEFRVAGELGRDKNILYDIRHKVDVHSVTRDIICAAGEEVDRTEAKPYTFRPLFLGNSGTPAQKKYYSEFRKKYHGIYNTQQKWIREVCLTKKLRIPSGLEFFWPDTKVNPSGYVTNQSTIGNAPIQSTATADIIPIAITYLWHEMKARGMKSFIINTVHDSSITEVYPPERELYEKLVVQCYTHRVYKYLKDMYGLDWTTPLGVGIKTGKYWGDGEEQKIDLENNSDASF